MCFSAAARNQSVLFPDQIQNSAPFTIRLCHEDKCVMIPQCSEFFETLLSEILDFFATGKSPVDSAETIEIAALLEAGVKAIGEKGVWHTL